MFLAVIGRGNGLVWGDLVPECELACMMREADRATCWDEPTFWYLLTVEAARARRA